LALKKMKFRKTYNRGQTALEYAMILALIILPLAAALTSIVQDEEGKENSNMVRKIVTPAFGDERSLGVIGRPYP